MKIFLFLYPIRWYIDREIDDYNERRACVNRFNAMIEARYRKQGFRIFWLLFCEEGNETEVDLELLEPLYEIRPEDTLFSAGISLIAHKTKLIYPSLYLLFKQIPRAEQLVIGGFHQTDCVEKFASYAHSRGIRTFVDEDVTDMFFKLRRMYEMPPVESTPEEYAARFREMLQQVHARVQHRTYEYLLELHREERREKPWLVMI